MMLTKILLPKKFKPFPHPPLTLFQVSSITADLNLDLNLMCKVRCFVSNRSKTIRMQVFLCLSNYVLHCGLSNQIGSMIFLFLLDEQGIFYHVLPFSITAKKKTFSMKFFIFIGEPLGALFFSALNRGDI